MKRKERFGLASLILTAAIIAAGLARCGIEHVKNDRGAEKLLLRLEEMGLPPSAEVVASGSAVGNFSSTGNEIDVLGYRIVKTTAPDELKRFYADFEPTAESTIEHPRVEIIALKDVTLGDPGPLRDRASEWLSGHGRDLHAVFAVVRYSDGALDWRGR